MALRKPATAIAAALVLIATTMFGFTATAAANAAAPTGEQQFAAQAKAAGLTAAEAAELQSTVDGYVAREGGTQVAANKVAVPGKGEITVALPGERYARDLTTGARASCPYENFCMFTGTYYSGTQFNLWKCQSYALSHWNSSGSWINNQTPGTRARFQDRNRNTIYTTPGAYAESPDYNWVPVWYVVPC
ncbi:hypothetical protein [Streptomyces sp. NPDC047928]|uniref:hypothetical protein n=1 Tax=unclassified Streptomyces TaxID=2593676 RepID=UPI0037233B49